MSGTGLGAKLGDAYVTVSVDASKVGPELEAKVDTALEGVVASSDAAMAEVASSAEGAAAKVSEAFAAASAKQQDSFLRASAAAESASARVVAAQNAQTEATLRVAEAEKVLATARATNDEEKIAGATAALASSRGKLEVATAKVSAAEAVATKATADLSVATAELGAVSETTAAKSEAAAGTIASKWGAMAGLVGGATAVLLVKTAGDYQQQLTKLSTTAGESVGNLKMVGDGMLKMAGDVGISAQHLSEGMYTVESSGVHGADALVVLKAAAQGAKQENADLEKVTDAVTTALHDYHLPASDAATVTSQLVDAVAHGKTTFDALTGSLHSVTPLASVLGVSLADVTGVLSSMTASGMSADQATQNMADTLRHLANPTNVMTQELAQLGISSSDLSDMLGKKGLSGTLQTVEEAIVNQVDPATKRVLLPALNKSKEAANDLKIMMGSMPAGMAKMSQGLLDGSVSIAEYTKGAKALGGQAGPMATQFLSLYKSSDGFNSVLKAGGPAAQSFEAAMAKSFGTASAMNVALQTTGENAAMTNKAVKDIGNAAAQSDGSIKGWSEVQGNFNQKLSETVAAIKSWAIQLGQKLLPVATKIVGAVKDLVDWTEKHSTATKVITTVVGGLLGLFLVYKTTVGAMALASKAWSIATGIATAAQKLLGIATEETNVAMELNPIGILVAALALLVVGVIYAWNHFKWFREAIEAVGHWLKHAGEAIGHFAEKVWGALGAAIDWVKAHWPLILEILAGPIGWAIALFTAFGPKLLHLISEGWHKLTGWLTGTAGPALGHFFSSLPGRILHGLEALLTTLFDWGIKVVLFFVLLPVKIAIALAVIAVKVGAAFVAAFDYLKTNIPIWIGNVLHFFAELPGKVYHLLDVLTDKLADVFRAAFDYLKTNIPIWIGNVIHFFAELPGKVIAAAESLREKLHDLLWRAIDWAKNAVVTGIDDIVAWFRKLPGRIGEMAGDMVSAGGHLITSLLNGLGNAGGAALDVGKKVVNAIIGFINGHVIDNIDSALNFSVMGVNIHAGVIPHIPMLAQGGVIDRPTLAIVGEDGPEAVVPLTKPRRAADVMGMAGLGGSAGGTHLHVHQELTVPKQATAAEAAALFAQNLERGIRLGATRGSLAGLAS